MAISAGSLDFTVEILGTLLGSSFDADTVDMSVTIHGFVSVSQVIHCGPINVTIDIVSLGVMPEADRRNWVKWTKIGALDFTIDQSNVAGERPLDWKGSVYDLMKLDKAIIAYGENGVSVLNPVNTAYGLQTINRLGVKCKTAVAGTEFEHYFVDKQDRLYKVSQEGVKLLDYSEYIGELTDPVLVLDISTGLLYICDEENGYIYNTLNSSFGEGPESITGIGSQGGSLYVVSPTAIDTPKMHIITDIYDFGTRKPKTIQTVEVGTDLTDKLHVKVESRISNKDDFLKSAWILVNPNGIAYAPCYGVEFRFHIKSRVYEYLEIDYLKVNGIFHGFSYLERVD